MERTSTGGAGGGAFGVGPGDGIGVLWALVLTGASAQTRRSKLAVLKVRAPNRILKRVGFIVAGHQIGSGIYWFDH
jgi:hypothetical protein